MWLGYAWYKRGINKVFKAFDVLTECLYSWILSKVNEPIRLFIPPHQIFYKRYTVEYYFLNTNISIKYYRKV